MRIGRFQVRLCGRRDDDPYWDAFVNAEPADPNNVVAVGVRGLSDGSVYAIRTDVHSPEVMSQHVKDLALFLGADRCGVVDLQLSSPATLPILGEERQSEEYPFAVVCV